MERIADRAGAAWAASRTAVTRGILTAVAAGLLALAVGASAVTAQTGGRIDFETYRLDNGLRVILSEDHSTPVVAVNVWYDVGSRNDPPDRSGFAHLFEHMMFQGSENVDKTEHLTMVESVGGSVNGTTAGDRTNYFETVPANRVNLALWLEADRMRSLRVTKENFENQRETVKEERRLRVDNPPYQKAFRMAQVAPYDPERCFGYSRMGIGSMEDLDAATVEDARAFHRAWYVPNNATLTVVGDFDPELVKDLVERYFGAIPAGEVPEEKPCEVDYSAGLTVDTVPDPNANLPGVIWSFRAPPHAHPDARALALLSRILGQGESSRLYGRMVREAGAATQVGTFFGFGNAPRKGPGLLIGFAIANQGVSPDSLRALFRDEIERLRTDPPTADELEKAKAGFESSYVMGRQRVMQKAETLQHFAHYHDDVSEVNEALDGFLSVDLEDLRRVTEKYVRGDNMTVLVDLPVEEESGSEADPETAAGSATAPPEEGESAPSEDGADR